MNATTAQVHGEVRIEQRVDMANIGYWLKASDWVSWQARIPQVGRYQLSMEVAGLSPNVPFVVELAGQKLDGKAVKTEDYDNYRTVQVGVVEIRDAGPCEVKVRPKDAASWKPFNLRKLVLSPAKK